MRTSGNSCQVEEHDRRQKFSRKTAGRLAVKNVSGSYAATTGTIRARSQMTVSKVMNVIARLPGCAGQAADAVSAYTPSQHGGRSSIAETSQVRRVQTSGYVYQDRSGQIHLPTLKNRWFFLNQNCTDPHLLDNFGKDNSKMFCRTHGLKKVPNWECLLVHRHQGLFLFVYVADTKMLGKKHDLGSMWKKLMKLVDMERTYIIS